MINSNMSFYNYFTFGDTNSYGQQVLSPAPIGKIKMSISLTTQSTQDNINYTNAQYLGLTNDKSINDTYVIEYGELKLKVLFVNRSGRLTQVFMEKM